MRAKSLGFQITGTISEDLKKNTSQADIHITAKGCGVSARTIEEIKYSRADVTTHSINGLLALISTALSNIDKSIDKKMESAQRLEKYKKELEKNHDH